MHAETPGILRAFSLVQFSAGRRSATTGKHRDEDAIAQEKMMEQSGARMESGDPQDNVPQYRVQRSQRKPDVMRWGKHRADVPETPKRERMPFQPRADDSGNRSRDQETVEHHVDEFGGISHPWLHRRIFWCGIHQAPQEPDKHEREHGDAQRLMGLPSEVGRAQIHALLGSAWPREIGRYDQDRREPMEYLGHGAIAKMRTK